MKINLYIFLITLVLSTTAFSQSGQKNFIDQPYIEVTGQVETKITTSGMKPFLDTPRLDAGSLEGFIHAVHMVTSDCPIGGFMPDSNVFKIGTTLSSLLQDL